MGGCLLLTGPVWAAADTLATAAQLDLTASITFICSAQTTRRPVNNELGTLEHAKMHVPQQQQHQCLGHQQMLAGRYCVIYTSCLDHGIAC